MSLYYTQQHHEEIYATIYAEEKAKGLSDMEADIMTVAYMYPKSTGTVARKYGKTQKEINEIVDRLWEMD